jgi:hypothetical protein
MKATRISRARVLHHYRSDAAVGDWNNMSTGAHSKRDGL